MMLRIAASLSVLAVGCARMTPSTGTATPPLGVTTFDSAWALINTTYFDSTFGGRNWQTVRTALGPEAGAATTTDALRGVIRRMLATLGESHARILAREDVQPSTGAGALAEPGIDVRPSAGAMLVVRVDSGSPAAAAGVRPGWVLDAVGGEPVAALSRREVYARLRGESGTAVGVVLRDTPGNIRELRLTRTIPAGILVITPNLPPRVVRFRVAEFSLAGDATVGLIQFDQWLLPVAAALDSAIYVVRNAHGLIIDLRGNGGGLGAMVAGFAGYFVDSSTTVGVVRTRESVLHLVAQPRVAARSGAGATPIAGPLAILVDRFTASASEVFASGLQSTGRARVFGDTTAGAVLPSALDRLPNGDILQHPIADFVTVTGVRLEGRGVWPDEPVIPTPKDYVNDEDPVLSAATRWIRATHHTAVRGDTMKAALTILLATATSLHAGATQPAEAQDAVRTVAKYVAAIGGEEAIRRAGSRHMVGELTLPAQSIKGSIESHAAAPDMLLVRTTLPAFGSTQTGYDGSTGWSVSDLAGAAILSGRQLDQLRAAADLLAPLHANVRSLTWLGLRDFQGRSSAAIAVVSQDGDSYTEFFDVESNLLIGIEQHIATPGGDVPTTTSLEDYRDSGGVLVPTTITQRLPGGQVMVTRITSIDQRPIDRGLFAPPESVRRLITRLAP